MDMRSEVWSPLQNASVWLAAWLHGLESTDELVDAWRDLGLDASPELLRLVRGADFREGEPRVRLVLSGPGEASGLPDGLTEAIAVGNGGLVRADARWLELATELPSPHWLSPGDADAQLTRATDEAARMVEASGYRTDELASPRLTVGTLADFYDTPGLPGATPPRAAKLFARADRVAAIVETVTGRMGDHSLDPQLLGLWRHIRAARMAGVSYAAADFAR